MRGKLKVIFLCFIVCIGFTACGEHPDIKPDGSSVVSDRHTSIRPLFNAKSSIFNSLMVTSGNIISADFSVYLSETEANFLYIEVEEEMELTLNYTYSTEDVGGVKFGYYSEGGTEKIASILDAATDEAYNAIWLEKTISLKKGTNVFYLSGDNCTCKMLCEIRNLDEDKVVYVGGLSERSSIA